MQFDDFFFPNGQDNFAYAVDYAINDVLMTPESFMTRLIDTIGPDIENKHPKYIVGSSGYDLVYLMFNRNNPQPIPLTQHFSICETDGFTKEYWAGYVLFMLQWHSDRSFEFINRYLPLAELINMYHPLHEASDAKILKTLEDIIAKRTKIKENQ